MHDFLALVRDCQSWEPHVRYAASLAARLHGSLTGIYVSPLSMPIPDVASPALTTEIIEIHREESERAKRAETPFRHWAAAHGVQRSAWRLTEGPDALALEAVANWYDALVVERAADAAREDAGELGRLMVRVDLPFFIVPATTDMARLATIAVAWNGSAESVRSMHAALPLLRLAERIVVVCGERHEPFAASRWNPAIDPIAWLDWQGLRAERVDIRSSSDHAGATILAQAARVAADLLVLGAYGRTRFSEWFLGGVTRHVLEHAALPLFMRH